MREIIITKRDKDIFQFLFENKISSRAQIAKHFFNNQSQKTVNRRLRKLINSKYISSAGEEINGKFIRYLYLGRKGCEKVKMEEIHYKIEKVEKSESIEHDLELLNLRYQINKSPKIKLYYTENMLQGIPEFKKNESLKYFIKLNSDAAIFLNLKLGEISSALEYETFPKTKLRYEEKIRAYYESNIGIVIYVTRSEKLNSALKEIDQKVAEELRRPNKIFCSTYDAILANPKKLVFVNSSGKLLDLLS